MKEIPAYLQRDCHWMRHALEEAYKAAELHEIPVGAVIVYQNEIIARAHNRRELDQDALAHAEVLCIQQACQKLGSWRLSGCELYVTCLLYTSSFKRTVQKHHCRPLCTFPQGTHRFLPHQKAATGGNHRIFSATQSPGDLLFHLTKSLFSLLRKNLRDAFSFPLFNHRIGVQKLPPQPKGERLSDAGFAASHKAAQ